MTASSVDALLGTLILKAQAVQTLIENAAKAASVDLHSSHTYYGLPEAIIDDIREATDLMVLVEEKMNTVWNDTAVAPYV